MTDSVLLRQAIDRSGLKIGYVAEKLNLSRFGFYKKLNGESPFNQYEIIALCKLLGINTLKEREKIFFVEK